MKIFNFFFILVLIVISFWGCAGAGDNDEMLLTGPGNLEGRIKDTEDNKVNGASVYLKGTDVYKSSITNIDGDFFFSELTAGEYQLDIIKSGFSDYSQNVIVLPEKTSSYTIQLQVVSTSTINLSGILSTNLTLESNSPKVVIHGDLLIPQNITLVASEGVVIEFAKKDTKNSGDYADLVELIVEGSLIASGTDGKPVVFQGTGGSTPGLWGQIKFVGGSGTSRIAGAQITGATIGIHAVNASLEMTKNIIQNSLLEGIFVEGQNFSKIESNTVSNNRGDGIRVAFKATPLINNNTIKNSGKSGLSLFDAGGVISSNIVEKNLANGIEIFSSSPGVSSNSLAYNSQNGLYIENSGGTLSGNIIVSNGLHGTRLIGTTTTVLNNNYFVQNGGQGINSNYLVRANISGNLICINGGGGYLADNSESNFINNIVSANTGEGILCVGSTTDIINYNIILSNSGSGIKSENSAPTLRNNVIQGNLTGLLCQGVPFPTTDYNIYYKNSTNFDSCLPGSNDQTTLDPEFIDPRSNIPWMGDFSLATASLIKGKGISFSNPGLLTPKSVGKLASGTPGYSHLSKF
ncbi:right-handed parallel beta-helix repeat-containing protein [Candidatus Riflebacteria bacterium]